MLNTENNQQNSRATPGWNDPPPANIVTNGQPTPNNRFNLQRLRRPVDPSVQGTPLIAPPSQQNAQELSAPTNTHFHQSRSFPQLHSPGPFAGTGMGTHPGSAFSPTPAAAAMLLSSAVQQSQSQNSLIHNPSQFTFASANPHVAMHTHPHSHTNLPTNLTPSSMAPNLPQPPTLQSIPPALNAGIQQSNAPIPGHHYDQSNHSTAVFHTQPQNNLQSQQNSDALMPQISTNNMSPMTGEEPTNGQHPTMLFSPPNIVPMQQSRPSTQPVTNNYRIPVKAAGDVSLSGTQLIAFLTKGTLLLPQGPMREGIQLRINQFGDLVQLGQISEPCLKKLNFVVDAIDRRIYEEAWQFFEQMLATYPNDCAQGGWAHGIKLLIQELRKAHIPNRAHSAGARHF